VVAQLAASQEGLNFMSESEWYGSVLHVLACKDIITHLKLLICVLYEFIYYNITTNTDVSDFTHS
jgi:hypothetical protein